MEGGVDNCLVIIHSSLLSVFLSLLGNSRFPVKEGSTAPLILLCPPTLPLRRGETL